MARPPRAPPLKGGPAPRRTIPFRCADSPRPQPLKDDIEPPSQGWGPAADSPAPTPPPARSSHLPLLLELSHGGVAVPALA